MSQVPPKKKAKTLSELSEEEISKLEKNDLIDRIRQLEAHNQQLRNIISKQNTPVEIKEKRKKPFDFAKCHYRRVLLKILYFGWDYQGLAVQEDSNQTIEHHLFQALTKACLIESRETSNYHRCGRTDKGVSAFGQVISISLRSKLVPGEQNNKESLEKELPYCKVINRLLPKEIRAVAWMPIPVDKPEYSARFDCTKRTYKYYFPHSNLNIISMREACKHLVGSHDFRNLCKMDVGNGVTEFVREIFAADILDLDGEGATQMHCLQIEGNAFLWHQIRCIMSVLLLVGEGLQLPSVVQELLDVQHCPRKPQYSMALDVPLNLFHCCYDLENERDWFHDEVELKTVIQHIQNYWTIHSVKTTMIKDCLNSLEEKYIILKNPEVYDIYNHSDCLVQGVKSKVYKPLLEREVCSSLEERIEHYSKKRKL